MWSDNARHAAAQSRKMKSKGKQKQAGDEYSNVKHKPKLGSGKRFDQLEHKLDKKGVKNPGALAAYIGRKKYGAKKFNKLAAKGK